MDRFAALQVQQMTALQKALLGVREIEMREDAMSISVIHFGYYFGQTMPRIRRRNANGTLADASVAPRHQAAAESAQTGGCHACRDRILWYPKMLHRCSHGSNTENENEFGCRLCIIQHRHTLL